MRRGDTGDFPAGDAEVRDGEVRRVLIVVLVANTLVAALKVTLGLWIGSLALLADAIHSGLDASSNVVGLVGITVAGRPPDAGHPYGHRKFETIASLVIGILIAAGLFEILQRAFEADHAEPTVTWLSIVLVASTIVSNIVLSRYEHRKGEALRSSVLHADASHTASDALGALVVLVSLLCAKFGLPGVDMIAALLVSLIIAHTAWRVLTTNLDALADGRAVDAEAIHGIATAVPGVLGAHRVRSRRSGDAVYVDLHVVLERTTPLHLAHDKTHEVMDAIRAALPEVIDVVVHTEPLE